MDENGDSLTYSLSDGDPLHASFFSIDSSSGQISLKPGTRSGVYRVRVSVSDDMFDSDDSDTAAVDVVIHVTSPGHYLWEDSWVLARSMTAGGVTSYNYFGWGLDATSEVIVVGAAYSAPGNNGAVYVFDADSGRQLAKLTSPNAQTNGYFGLAVAGDTIFVSAWPENSTRGRVYVFAKPSSGGWADTGTATATLTPAAAHAGTTAFGSSLAVSDDGKTLAVGMSRFSLADGAVVVFAKPPSGGGWADATETAELAAGFGHKYDQFGRGVAVSGSGDRIAVSNAWSRSSNYRGSVYVYAKPSGGWADDLDGAGDNLRVLTLADADTNRKHRYALGDHGLAFIGENQLVASQRGYVEALNQKDELTTLPAGGLYGDNDDQSIVANRRAGSAHLFKLRQAPGQQPVAPPPPPPPPPPPDEPEEPAEPEPEPIEFADVDEGSVHAESIEKVAALGITSGTTDRTFSPSDAVTRAQMATFLARFHEALTS